MENNGNGVSVVKNGISSLLSSSSESDDISTQPNSNEKSTSSANRSIDTLTSVSTESRSPFSPISGSQDTMSDVHLPDSKSISSDYSGTRFVVKRMASSELQSVSSTSNSSSKIESTSVQVPRSVAYSVEQIPSTSQAYVKSQQKKSTRVLSRSPTTDSMPKILEMATKTLSTPKSDDSIQIVEEIELLPFNRGPERNDSSDEDIFVIEPDRANSRLLSDSEADLVNRTQSFKTKNVRGPAGTVTVSVDEIPIPPSASERPPSSFADRCCGLCIRHTLAIYVIIVIASFLCVALGLLIFGNNAEVHKLAKNDTSNGNSTDWMIGTLLPNEAFANMIKTLPPDTSFNSTN